MQKKMKALITYGQEKLKIKNIKIPDINENQILVKMKYVGICGSDIHIFYGKHPFVGFEYLPLVQGHEGVATVIKTGDNVNNLSVGDNVTIMPQLFCGECEMCKSGNPHICETLKVLGCQADGLLSEYFAVDASLAIKLNAYDDLLDMTLIEPLAVAVGGVKKLGSLAGKKVLVFGAGVIGNLCAQVAKVNGAMEVAIADICEHRISFAVKSCHVDKGIFIPGIEESQKAEVYGDYNCFIECVGIESTMATAIKYSKKKSEIVVIGVFGKDAKLPMALVQDKELIIKGSLMYQEIDFLTSIDYIRKNLINVKDLVFSKVPFDESEKVYDIIKNNKEKALKVVVEF